MVYNVRLQIGTTYTARDIPNEVLVLLYVRWWWICARVRKKSFSFKKKSLENLKTNTTYALYFINNNDHFAHWQLFQTFCHIMCKTNCLYGMFLDKLSVTNFRVVTHPIKYFCPRAFFPAAVETNRRKSNRITNVYF